MGEVERPVKSCRCARPLQEEELPMDRRSAFRYGVGLGRPDAAPRVRRPQGGDGRSPADNGARAPAVRGIDAPGADSRL